MDYINNDSGFDFNCLDTDCLECTYLFRFDICGYAYACCQTLGEV